MSRMGLQIMAQRAEPQRQQQPDTMTRILQGVQIANGLVNIGESGYKIYNEHRLNNNELNAQEQADIGKSGYSKVDNPTSTDIQATDYASGKKFGFHKDVAPTKPNYMNAGNTGDIWDLNAQGGPKRIITGPGQPTKLIDVTNPDGSVTRVPEAPGIMIKPPAPAGSKGGSSGTGKLVDVTDAEGNVTRQPEVAGMVVKSAKETPKGYENIMAKLPSTDKLRVQLLGEMNVQAQRMKDALANGDNTFSIIGDNDYTAARREYNMALTRLQSGANAPPAEVAMYESMLPKISDSADQQQAKLESAVGKTNFGIQSYGLDPEEVLKRRLAAQPGSNKTTDTAAPKVQSATSAPKANEQQFPLTLRKDGKVATISNANELREAAAQGWK